MRTQAQIDKIKEKQSTPIQQFIFLNELEVEDLLFYYNNNLDKAEIKPTGPKCLYIKEGEGVIDDILARLRQKFGNFKLRNAQIFDTTVPHMLHNDDGKDLPNAYKAFTIPLEVFDGNPLNAKLVMFDQYYYGGPAKFCKGETFESNTYNSIVTDYKDIEGLDNKGIPEGWRTQLLSHLKDEWIEGLTIQGYYPWVPGSYIAFDALQIHCASNFVDVDISRKIGLSIFTTL
jgi:hypothetical protein